MKIMFVTPTFNVVQGGKGSKAKIQYGNMPPLGVLYMAGELRRHGHEVQLIDATTTGAGHDEILGRIREFDPGLVGVSTMTPSAPAAYDLVRFLKGHLDVPVIIGGVHCNSFQGKVLEDLPQADAVCVGEGEQTIVELVKAFEGGMALEDVKGIFYRDTSGKIVGTESRPLNMDLDTLAFPARDLVDHSPYSLLPGAFKRLPITSMITSRGCPYGKCSFCFEAGNHAFKFRRNSPEYVMREIEETLIPLGIREIAFWDDIFLVNHKWVEQFTQLIKKYDLTWSCYAWPKPVTKAMLEMASDAGCWAVSYGFESGDQKLLDVIEKNMTLEHSRQAAKWTHDAGMATRALFMLALPGETPELAKKTVEFAIEMDCTMAQFHPTFPEPGTPLYDRARLEGQILTDFHGRMKAAYIPHGYKDAEEVENTVRWAYRRFYLRPSLMWKYLSRIRTWEDVVHIFNGVRFFFGLLMSEKSSSEPKKPPTSLSDFTSPWPGSAPPSESAAPRS